MVFGNCAMYLFQCCTQHQIWWDTRSRGRICWPSFTSRYVGLEVSRWKVRGFRFAVARTAGLVGPGTVVLIARHSRIRHWHGSQDEEMKESWYNDEIKLKHTLTDSWLTRGAAFVETVSAATLVPCELWWESYSMIKAWHALVYHLTLQEHGKTLFSSFDSNFSHGSFTEWRAWTDFKRNASSLV